MKMENLKEDPVFLENQDHVFSDSDNDDVGMNRKHELLVDNLSKKYKNKREHKWKSDRTEAQPEIGEFTLVKSRQSKLQLPMLVKLSKNSLAKKSLKSFHNKKVLPKPLKKQIAEKAARKVNFKEVSEEISKYDPIVKEIRHADQLVFPMNQEKVSFKVGVQLEVKPDQKNIKSIEKEITEQIAISEGNVETDERPLTENELAVLKAKNIEEARMLHKQIQHRRMLISYQEAKFRRLRKIKSKKYHRLMKKDKLKKTVEEFDKLVAENSDKAMDKLQELDRLRALERASLKHLNTGKWSKHNKIRAKYDDNAREELNKQLSINNEMLKKRSMSLLDEIDNQMSDEDDESNSDQNIAHSKPVRKAENSEIFEIPHNYNPWISNTKPQKKKKKIALPSESTSSAQTEDNTESFFTQRIKKRIQDYKTEEINDILRRDALDEKILDEGIDTIENNEDDLQLVAPKLKSKAKTKHDDNDNNDSDDDEQTNLNTSNLISNIEDIKKSNIVVSHEMGEEQFNDSEDDAEMDDINFNNNEMQQYLREAFAEDDVIEEFMKEKKQMEKNESKSTQKSLYLPGWGSWAGAGIAENRRKRNRMIKKFEQVEKRMDKKICNAIILDSHDKIGAKFRLAYRPADVNNVENFEHKCLKPIGANWNPEMVRKALNEPKIITKIGTIIEPMESKIVGVNGSQL